MSYESHSFVTAYVSEPAQCEYCLPDISVDCMVADCGSFSPLRVHKCDIQQPAEFVALCVRVTSVSGL